MRKKTIKELRTQIYIVKAYTPTSADVIIKPDYMVAHHDNDAKEPPQQKIDSEVMREARVFILDPDEMKTLQDGFSSWHGDLMSRFAKDNPATLAAVRNLKKAKQDHDQSLLSSEKLESVSEKYMATIREGIQEELDIETSMVDFPSPLPFQANLFVGFNLHLGARPNDLLGLNRGATLFGLLVSDRMADWVFCDSAETFKLVPLWRDGYWMNPETLYGPWMLNALIHTITHHKDLVKKLPRSIDDSLIRSRVQRKLRAKRLPPSEYYTIDFPSTYVDAERRSIFPKPRNWTHRWDVVGNYAVRWLRGEDVLDQKVRRNLLKRGYKIFLHGDELDAETRSIAEPREISPPKTNEWLAILAWWRRDHIKGPEEKPYVPGMRTTPTTADGTI